MKASLGCLPFPCPGAPALHLVKAAAGRQGHPHGRCFGGLRTEKEPVVATETDAPQGVLSLVVVNLQTPVLEVGLELDAEIAGIC